MKSVLTFLAKLANFSWNLFQVNYR